MKHAFISHASKDHETALKIRSLLESRGITCWIAPDDIVPGRDYGEEIIRGLEQTVTTVLLLSENSNASPFVKREIERAVSKGKPVLPIRIQNVLPSPGLELFISSSHWIDVWQQSIESKIDELADAIRGRVDASDAAPVPVAEAPARKAPQAATPQPRPPSRPVWHYALATVILAALVVGGALFFRMDQPSDRNLKSVEAAGQSIQPKDALTPALTPPTQPTPLTQPTPPAVVSSPAAPEPAVQPPTTSSVDPASAPVAPAASLPAPPARRANTEHAAKPLRPKAIAHDTRETIKAPHASNSVATGSCTSALQRASLGEPLSNEEKTLLRTKC